MWEGRYQPAPKSHHGLRAPLGSRETPSLGAAVPSVDSCLGTRKWGVHSCLFLLLLDELLPGRNAVQLPNGLGNKIPGLSSAVIDW